MKWLLYTLVIYGRDVSAMPRQQWFYPRRIGLAGAGALMLALALIGLRGNSSAPGVTLFRWLLVGLVVVAFMLAVWAGGNLLLRDRQLRMLDLLLLSELGWGQLIIAKFLYTATFVLLMLVSALPIIAICYGLGGVSPTAIGLSVALIICVTLLGSGVGVCVSCIVRDPVQVRVWSGALAALLFLVVPAALALIASHASLPQDQLLILVSPIRAVLALVAGTSPHLLEWHLLMLLAVTLAALLLARLLLPRSLVALQRPGLVARINKDLQASATMQRLTLRPQLTGNPVSWMDLHMVFGGYRLSTVKLLLFSTVLVAVILTFCSIAELPLAEAGVMVWRFLTLFYGSIIMLGTISRSSMAFDRELRDGALDVLLTSDLTNRELLQGKAMGIVLAFSPYALALLACLTFAFTFLSDPTSQLTLLLSTLEMLGVWFACCSVAFFLSIRFGHSNNIVGGCVIYSIVWAMIVFIFPINGVVAHVLFAIISSIWHGYLGLLCWRLLDRRCRHMLLRNPPAPDEERR